MMTIDLTGKAALVTGGASGIGLATVEMFARAGGTIAINHLPEDPRGEQEVKRLQATGYRVVSAPGNVGRAGEAEPLVSAPIDPLRPPPYPANNPPTPPP